ncbi:transferrin-binding protein-like solute binding protein [Lonepinella sp. BR2474]|uniref:transferrin-binding protein-like solute binding protein n=1 Tax=Lonepinella sp. BR2474 TaxID=3434548 RepID=UPI003F6E2653
MQNPFKLSAIVIACGLALSACSSSSSSGDTPAVTPSTQITQAEKLAAEKAAAEKAAAEKAAAEKAAAEKAAAEKAAAEKAAAEKAAAEKAAAEKAAAEKAAAEKAAAEKAAAEKAAAEKAAAEKAEAAKKAEAEAAAKEAAKKSENSFGVKTWTDNDNVANFDKITIDGVEVDLAKAKTSAHRGNPKFVKAVFHADSAENSGYSKDFSNATVISSKTDAYTFANVVAGATQVGDSQYLFVQGAKSTDTPTSGTASYIGGSLRFNEANKDNLFQASGVSAGAFTANVDFGSKTITGTIRDDGQMSTAEAFSGSVSGNGFTATWDDANTGKGLEGNFYGSAAAEVGGQFERSDSFGVFVGAKQ